MSRQSIWSFGLLGGGLVIAALMIALRPQAESEDRIEEAPLVEIVAFEPSSGPIPVLASGTVQPLDEVVVGVQVSGRLTYVNPAFRQGGTVAKGTTLLRIDAEDYVNRVRQAEADVAAQNVTVLQAQQEVAIATSELQRYAQREAQLASSQANGNTSTILPPDALASILGGPRGNGPELPTADTNQETLDPTGLAAKEPQLSSAQASQQRASASLADAKLALSRTQVSSPFNGIVRSADASVGTLVQPGQVLGSIVSTAAYEVRVTLSPDDAALIPGLFDGSAGRIPAVVYSEYGGQIYRWLAYVARASELVDAGTRNLEVFLRVPSPRTSGRLVGEGGSDTTTKNAPPLLAGSFTQVEIIGSSLESYAAIPASAVRAGNEIWVVEDGKLKIITVRVIQRSEDIAYVSTPNLGQGGRLIVSNLRTPVNGMPVRVRGAAKK